VGLFSNNKNKRNNAAQQGLDPDISELLGVQPQTSPSRPLQQPVPRPGAKGSPPAPQPAAPQPAPLPEKAYFTTSSATDGSDLDDLSDFLEDDTMEPEPEPEPEPVPEPVKQAPSTAQQQQQAAAAPQQAEQPVKPEVDEEEYRIKGMAATHLYKQEINFEPRGFIRRAVDGESPELIRMVAKMKKLFDNPADKKDKFLHRQKLTGAYWNLLSEAALKVNQRLPLEKLLLIRYGLLDASYLRPEHITMIQSIPLEKTQEEPVYYMDEWLRQISTGQIKPSLVDETRKVMQSNSRELDKLQRKTGARDAELSNLKNKLSNMDMLEGSLQATVNMLLERDKHPVYEGIKFGYTKQQLDGMNDVLHCCRKLSAINKEIETQFRVLSRLEEEIEQLRSAVPEGAEVVEVNSSAISDEFNSLRQMLKMCTGRQGNHFPILYAPYFNADPRQICTRENVLDEIKLIEKFDPGLFMRRYKQEEHRIMPYIIICPGYGESGICWEPFDKYNKATSRGRVAVSMFTKNVRRSVLTALADLRWQVAKEMAQHYWMEEGLTGKYYEYYTLNNLKGDIKMHFINDYMLWITMESQGMQKLERESRPVFWRYAPFPQPLKEILKNRGFFYKELYLKDENRARSDGY